MLERSPSPALVEANTVMQYSVYGLRLERVRSVVDKENVYGFPGEPDRGVGLSTVPVLPKGSYGPGSGSYITCRKV